MLFSSKTWKKKGKFPSGSLVVFSTRGCDLWHIHKLLTFEGIVNRPLSDLKTLSCMSTVSHPQTISLMEVIGRAVPKGQLQIHFVK